MAFVKIPGLPGKVYVPDAVPGQKKKHLCRDCFSCEFCSDDRCRVCRRGSGRTGCAPPDSSPEQGLPENKGDDPVG